MLSFFKKNPKGEVVTFKINGMHCPSCSLNIDGELEDTVGVLDASTNYAKATSVVTFNPALVTLTSIQGVIEKLGYTVTSIK